MTEEGSSKSEGAEPQGAQPVSNAGGPPKGGRGSSPPPSAKEVLNGDAATKVAMMLEHLNQIHGSTTFRYMLVAIAREHFPEWRWDKMMGGCETIVAHKIDDDRYGRKIRDGQGKVGGAGG